MAGKSKHRELEIGPLPVDQINAATGLELVPGIVVLTRGAQVHAERRHPADFPRCLPHIATVIRGALYVGESIDHVGKCELVGRVQQIGSWLLVAVLVSECDQKGRYRIHSFYPISDESVEARKRRGVLKVLITK
jgi:hypothetical protein